MTKRHWAFLLACCLMLGLYMPANHAAGESIRFSDVEPTDWYYNEVCYVFEKGLMQGTSATTFSPGKVTSRGMIVTMLWRLEDEPTSAAEIPFTDVVSGSAFEPAIVWANSKGIVTGYADGRFNPNNPITREQLAAILYRFARYKGYDTTARADLSKFKDSDTVSSYAVDALSWANAVGLVTGTSASTLNTRGNAVRSQAAVIISRFCKQIAAGTVNPENGDKKAAGGKTGGGGGGGSSSGGGGGGGGGGTPTSSYTAPTYAWSQTETGYTCTAARTCIDDESKNETETVVASYSVKMAAGCMTAGKGAYTATFSNRAFAKQTKTVDIPAHGHNYVNHECTYCHEAEHFTVRFLHYDGTVLSTQSVAYGADAALPTEPVRVDYDFIGWDASTANIRCATDATALFVPTGEPTFVISNASAAPGEGEVVLTVALKNNPGISSLGLDVAFDSALTLKSVEYNTLIGGKTVQPQMMGSPVHLTWLSPMANVNGDWTFATLHFSVSESAATGRHNVTLTYDPDNVYNLAETNISFGVCSGAVTVVS